MLEEPSLRGWHRRIATRSAGSRWTSGVVHELAARKAKDNRNDLAIVRLEQLARCPGVDCGTLTATRTSRSSSVQEEPPTRVRGRDLA